MDDIKYEITDSPDEDSIAFIREELNKYNQQYSEPDNHKPITIIVRENDNVIGGLLGGTYWEWLYIDRFWINEKYRRKGLGKEILNAAEAEAIKRGCKNAHLDTHDFQALEFYKKNGYKIKSKLKNLPRGYNKYLMWKKLI
jgi:ribosomal protein S18 acetylase RimI-like enzyme